MKKQKKGYFITGTDTNVGKTVATFVLGVLLQEKGFDVGVMKPIQCAGHDAAFLKKGLMIKDSLAVINPYYAKEPLSPNLAFKRAAKTIHISKIIKGYQELSDKHNAMLVEGAGGLLVPIKKDYLMVDLIRDIDLEIIIVARLGLGTINHTLLTLEQARLKGLKVRGIVFNTAEKKKRGASERTNPRIIRSFGKTPIIGIIPFMKEINRTVVMKQCHFFKMNILFSENKKADSRNWQKWDRQYVWHPFTQMQDWLQSEPLVIDEAKGCYLKSREGKRYLDGISSLWVNLHGHQHKTLDEALYRQMGKVSHSTLLGLANIPSVELAKELVKIAPGHLKKVFYSDNGSTAVEAAIKMAYQYWQNQGKIRKKKIVHLEHSYHGDTLGGVSVGGIDLFHKVYGSLIFKTIQIRSPYYYRANKKGTKKEFVKNYLKEAEKVFFKKHSSIAALIVEPIVQGAAGMIVWPDGVLKGLEKLCRKYNILLILDEVATGFGRTGTMFACEHEHVKPDFLCLAKGISGGYLPLAATLTTKKIFDGFLFPYKDMKTFFHGHTYTGNPLACAIALANLEVFKKEKTLHCLKAKILFLSNGLNKFYRLYHVGDIRQKGFMVGIELVQDRETKKPYRWEEKIGIQVCEEARKKGLILRPLGHVIVLMPPLAITRDQIKEMLDITYQAIKGVTEEHGRSR